MTICDNHRSPSDSEKVLIISGTLAVLYFVVTWTNLGYFLFVFFLGGVSSCAFTTWYLSGIFYSYFKNGIKEMDRAGVLSKILEMATFSGVELWRRKDPTKDELKVPIVGGTGTKPATENKDETRSVFEGVRASSYPAESPKSPFCHLCKSHISFGRGDQTIVEDGYIYHQRCRPQVERVTSHVVSKNYTGPPCSGCGDTFQDTTYVSYKNDHYHPNCLQIRLNVGKAHDSACVNTCNLP